jgi:hypothetical protein
MIPNYIFDKEQRTLTNISIKDKLLNYRMWLYYCLRLALKKQFADKVTLINHYKVNVSEIDYELIYWKKQNDSLQT